MIGTSIRLAISLGLHLRNEDPNSGDSRKEARQQTWWTLHSLECLISTMTGRPPVVPFEDCTVAFPRSAPGKTSDDSDTARQTSRRRTGYELPQGAKHTNLPEDDKATSGSSRYLTSHLKVTLLSQKTLLELYSPRTVTHSWQVRFLIFYLPLVHLNH